MPVSMLKSDGHATILHTSHASVLFSEPTLSVRGSSSRNEATRVSPKYTICLAVYWSGPWYQRHDVELYHGPLSQSWLWRIEFEFGVPRMAGGMVHTHTYTPSPRYNTKKRRWWLQAHVALSLSRSDLRHTSYSVVESNTVIQCTHTENAVSR